MKSIYTSKLFFITVLLFLGNYVFGQRIVQIHQPSSGSTKYSIIGDATETKIPVAFNGHAENYNVDYDDWYTVLTIQTGQQYSSRSYSLNSLVLNLTPGEHTWYFRMYEDGNRDPVATTSTTFTVKHSIEVVNHFDLSYGGSLIKIDNNTTTSGQYAYKLVGEILPVGAINQEYNGTHYAWKNIPNNVSKWDRKPKDLLIYNFSSFDKNYDYIVLANDNGARLRSVLKVHTLLNAPSNFTVSTPFGQSPVLSWSSTVNPERSGYRVYKKYTTSSGTQTISVFTTGNTHTDTNFEGNIFFGDDEVEYWIVTEDIYGFSSNESQHISVDGISNYQWKVASDEENSNEIKTYSLNSNYPNPFNPTTQISYQIPENGFVNLIVYNALGQQVAELVNQHQSSGQYSIKFNAANLPSGVYIYKLQAGEFSLTKKMLLTK